MHRQAVREHLRMKDRRTLATISVIRHDVQVISVGLEGHTRGL